LLATYVRKLNKNLVLICYIRSRTFNYSAVSVAAVFTYRIKRNDVGIRINNAVAVNPKMLTSMRFVKKIRIVSQIEVTQFKIFL
jgi:hypothetical protein